jgi:hypothetical protein
MLQTPALLLIFLLEIVLVHSDAYFSKYEICASKRYMLKVPGECCPEALFSSFEFCANPSVYYVGVEIVVETCCFQFRN